MRISSWKQRSRDKGKASYFRIAEFSIPVADEILKFKSLMDAGILTQEEFEAKKKQLLGL